MSADLSRPLTFAMGLHDALDGFITFREAQHACAKMPTKADVPGLTSAINALSKLCRNRDWTTNDPLGIGGLLFDACRLFQLTGGHEEQDLLQELTDAFEKGMKAFLISRTWTRPPSQRLAFRELGLAIGLKALPTEIYFVAQ